MLLSRSSFNYFIALVAATCLFLSWSVSAAPAGSSGYADVDSSATRVRSPDLDSDATNSERFAAGLPPAKPRHLKDPTKHHHSRPSASPSASAGFQTTPTKRKNGIWINGVISIIEPTNSTLLGYVSRRFTPQGYYTVSPSRRSALEVRFMPDRPGFNVKVMDPQDERMSYVGAVADSMDTGAAVLGMVSKTLFRSKASHSVVPPTKEQLMLSSVQKTLSPIWTFDHEVGLLTPVYGGDERLEVFYMPSEGIIKFMSPSDLNEGGLRAILGFVPY